MGKATGFLDYQRVDNKELPVQERIKNFNEFHVPMSEEEREKQGARCMNCGVPMCQSGMKLSGMYTGCPLHNLIPEWNDEVYHGHLGHALSRLLKTIRHSKVGDTNLQENRRMFSKAISDR